MVPIYAQTPTCSSQKMYTFFGFYSIDSGDVKFFLA